MDPPDDLRRRLLLAAGALPIASSLGVFAGFSERVAAAGVGEVAGYEPALQPDKSTLQRWLQQLHDFGPIRATGTSQCRAFEEWLAEQFGKLGYKIERDRYRLTSWECDIKNCAVSIAPSSGATAFA